MAVLSKMKTLLTFLPLLASASPVSRRATLTPVEILNYALTLEHLEATFYRTGVANFTAADFAAAGYDGTVYDNFLEIAADEKDHVDFLTTTLQSVGGATVPECVYSFPVTDVKSFVAVAGILEGVGASAYLGAAKDIGGTDYITAAGSILTIEARHSSYIRGAQGQKPFPAPYDTPLPYNEVYTLAAPFIASCPASTISLPLKPFPRLSALSSTATPGQTIDFGTPDVHLAPVDDEDVPLFAAWFQPTGPVFSPVIRIDNGVGPFQTTVPPSIQAGQTYVVLTNCGERVGDDTVLAGPAIVEVA